MAEPSVDTKPTSTTNLHNQSNTSARITLTLFSEMHSLKSVTDSILSAIAGELDSMHASARQAFRVRDLARYSSFFTEDLRYVQPDGKQIGRDELIRDIKKQLSQFKTVDSEMTRETILINDNGTVTQILNQIGTYSVTVFLFFTKRWNIRRRGKYTYRRTEAGWRICNVEVLSEDVESTLLHDEK